MAKKTAKKPAKKAVKRTAKKAAPRKAKKKPAKKATKKVARKPAKKAVKRTAKKAAKKKSKKPTSTKKSTAKSAKNNKPSATEVYEDPFVKFADWAKKSFNQLFNVESNDRAKENLAAVDPTFRRIIENVKPEVVDSVSVGKLKGDGVTGSTARKWLLLLSNGDLSYVNRGTTRSPENAISASGKNVKLIVNANAFVKSVSFEGYKMLLHGVRNQVIEVTLDPKVKSNLDQAKKFANKMKKFI